MDKTEVRLARLEGRDTATIQMASVLMDDFAKLRDLLFDSEQELKKARFNKLTSVRELRERRDEYELEEAAMLATDDRAAGKNPEERKYKAVALIAEERKEGGRLHGLWDSYNMAQLAAEYAETEEQAAIDHFSAVRYAARMTAGMAYMLGG